MIVHDIEYHRGSLAVNYQLDTYMYMKRSELRNDNNEAGIYKKKYQQSADLYLNSIA